VILTLSEVKFREADFRHVCWLLVLTFHMMIYWWFGWRYREIEYTVRLYFAEMLPTLVLLFTVTTLTPRVKPANWSSYFDGRKQRFFAWYLAFWVVLAFSQYFMLHEIRPSVLPLSLCVVGLFAKSKLAHKILPVLMGLIFIVIGLVFPENL
jgi:glycerol uptake facilitator-like aquaporin